MSAGEPSEEELRAAYEAEIKQIGVDQVLLEQVVTLINLGMRRTGMAPGTEDERDPVQVRIAVEAVRALMPLVEQLAGPSAGPIREALSQMQLAYVRLGGETPVAPGDPAVAAADPAAPAAPAAPAPPAAPRPREPDPAAPGPGESGEAGGPAQRSGRLWVPGQP